MPFVVCLQIQKHPLPEVGEISGQRAYRKFSPAMTQFFALFYFSFDDFLGFQLFRVFEPTLLWISLLWIKRELEREGLWMWLWRLKAPSPPLKAPMALPRTPATPAMAQPKKILPKSWQFLFFSTNESVSHTKKKLPKDIFAPNHFLPKHFFVNKNWPKINVKKKIMEYLVCCSLL